MMIYGRPIRNPRLLLVSALLAASLLLPPCLAQFA